MVEEVAGLGGELIRYDRVLFLILVDRLLMLWTRSMSWNRLLDKVDGAEAVIEVFVLNVEHASADVMAWTQEAKGGKSKEN